MRAFKPRPGEFVLHAGERYILVEISNLREALCRHIASRRTVTLALGELLPDDPEPAKSKVKVNPDLAAIPADRLAQASMRMDLIAALVNKGKSGRTSQDIEFVAQALGKSVKTVYAWMLKFKKNGTIEVFLDKERSDKGKGRIDPEVEVLIQEAIRENLLKPEYGTYKDAHVAAKRACKEKNLKPPGLTVVRDRYLKIPQVKRVERRHGAKKARETFDPLMGSFPGAEHPLDVVQIDHTPADIIIVDDVYRKAIGRPTLTIAIDVFSRMVMGFNLWLEAPSAASVGLCLFRAMLPKDEWLARRGIKATWDCYGRPRKIHTDNAKEFRGTVLGRACMAYNIDLEQRPKGKPHYGGHVERGFRTFLRKAHTLSGTTFSNTKSKFEYDSSGKAILTLEEFDYWFTVYLTKNYHVDFHTGIRNTPAAKFQEGILGDDERPGIGLPERFLDPERLRLDFLPFEERTVQQYGVLIDHIHYNDDVLRPHICARDPLNPKDARKFIFRRDPRDVSVIYFWNPDRNEYLEIPTAHRGRSPVSLWEVRTAIRELNAKGRANVDENLIYEGIDEMREIERNAAAKTKTARRNEQRRAEAEKHRKQKAAAGTATQVAPEIDSLPAAGSAGTSAPAANARSAQNRPTQNRPAPASDGLLDDDEEVLPFADVDMRG